MGGPRAALILLCCLAANAGGPCDQFGAYCRMWEVVDFAELDSGEYLLSWLLQLRSCGAGGSCNPLLRYFCQCLPGDSALVASMS